MSPTPQKMDSPSCLPLTPYSEKIYQLHASFLNKFKESKKFMHTMDNRFVKDGIKKRPSYVV